MPVARIRERVRVLLRLLATEAGGVQTGGKTDRQTDPLSEAQKLRLT